MVGTEFKVSDPKVLFSFKTSKGLVTLTVGRNGKDLFGIRTSPDNFYFESTDCSGPLLTPAPVTPPLWPSRTIIGGPNPGQLGGGGDNIIYRNDPNDTQRDIFPGSQALATSEDCDPPSGNKIEVVNAEEVLDIDTVFTRPFHIESEDVPDLTTVQAQLDMLQEQLNNHYHKLKLGKKFKFPTGPAIFPDSP